MNYVFNYICLPHHSPDPRKISFLFPSYSLDFREGGRFPRFHSINLLFMKFSIILATQRSREVVTHPEKGEKTHEI